MQKDESGILKKYVEQFKLSDSRIEKEAIVTNILYFITCLLYTSDAADD